jgi:3-oxoacyl-[acyl-carrier protein] reductase
MEFGKIINFTSGYPLEPNPGNLAYSATKSAVNRFTTSASLEIAPNRITMNAIDPGPTDTGWMPPDLKKQLQAAAPFGRLGFPEDAALLVRFLASQESNWITGQILHSRGGF